MLAKSNPPQNLYSHSLNTAEIALQLSHILPRLSILSGKENFFELLFLASYLHDWGKVHIEFQKKLKGERNKWSNQRHEQFSAPFVRTLNINQNEIELLSRVVLAHHKNFEELSKRLFSEKEREYLDKEIYEFHVNLQKNVFCKNSIEYLKYLQRFLAEHYSANFTGNACSFKTIKLEGIRDPFVTYLSNFKAEIETWDESTKLKHVFFIGGLKQCDHLASGGIKEIMKLTEKQFVFLTGPSHAEEVARRKLTYLTLTSTSKATASKVASLIDDPTIRIRLTDGVGGLEYASVLKNIYAIAAGLSHSIGYGDNFLAV